MSELKGDHTDVLKPGNGALTFRDDEGRTWFDETAFHHIGNEVSGTDNTVLISSVAITAGMMMTGTNVRPDAETEMPELQRLASIGWREVHNMWASHITGRETAGLLLTGQDLDKTLTRREALAVIHTLLMHRDVPIGNENDATTHSEISFGSNDILSAELAALMQRSGLFGDVRLFLLTDVDGVYEDVNEPATQIPVIRDVDEYRHLAVDTNDPELKIGGMASKFEAADIAKAAGVDMWIYDPRDGHRSRAVAGEIGTYFPSAA